jgi:hypothetical protein
MSPVAGSSRHSISGNTDWPTIPWMLPHMKRGVRDDLPDLVFAPGPDLRKSPLLVFELVFHRHKSFDDRLDLLPELGSGQVLVELLHLACLAIGGQT